MQKKLET